MTTKTLNKLIKDYTIILKNLGFKLNPNFKDDFLHIKRMKSNSTKISYIKKDKIEGLEKNVPDFKLKPNDSGQREKYFQAVRPSKFLSSMVVDNNASFNSSLFNTISEQFNKSFISNIKSKLKLFSDDEIKDIYHSASVVGCMARQDKSYFQVYADCENLKLATLQDDNNTILIRSLLWRDDNFKNFWLDNTYEQSALNGDNEVRKEYQKRLLIEVINEVQKNYPDFNLGCNFFNCLDSDVRDEIQKDYKIKIFTTARSEGSNEEKHIKEGIINDSAVILKPIIKDFDYDNYCSFPYSDTFSSIGRSTGIFRVSENEGDDRYVCLRSQNGEDENNSGCVCDCCGDRVHEDEIHYSDYEQEYLCDECCVYVDERDCTIRRENATYNDNTGEYLATADLREC